MKLYSRIIVVICALSLLVNCKKPQKQIQKTEKNGNPIVADVGMADPHIKIYNNKAYLYATRDADKTAKQFVMPDWRIWSSDDLVNWKLETVINPTTTYMGESKRCWATDVGEKNGNYYFYFSNGNKDTGVMIGKTPRGPFKDALGKPLLPEDLTPIKEYDPTILIEDDANKTAYIAFGHHRSNDDKYYYMIARLNEDMISLAETPKEIKIIGNVNVLGGNDKPNLHKKNGLYYLSAGSHYAISENIYGPYVKTGNSGNNNYGIDSKAHGNYFDWNNQSFHTWCHFHLGKDVARYRESYISYLHYKDNGEMVTDTNFLDKHFATGVGQYDAQWEKIEAEWYMKSNNLEKRENNNNGFEVRKIAKEGALFYPNIHNFSNYQYLSCFAKISKGIIEVRASKIDGKILGTLQVKEGANMYKEYLIPLNNVKGVKDICLVLKGDESIALDWFKFK